MNEAWLGVDVGKEFHWAHALDASGTELLSRRVENDEASLCALIDEALSLPGEIVWAIDQPGGGATLLMALLWEHDQRVIYVPGLAVDRAREAYRGGESKTDQRDARVIAEQARMRADLAELAPEEEALAELAGEVLVLKVRLASLDKEIASRFFARPEALILASLPGMGPLLGSEFLVAVGDLSLRERRPTRRLRRSCAGLPRLRQEGWQEEGGKEAHPGPHRARQTKGQRPVGDAARRNHLRTSSQGLTFL